jgi:hypothetical protein
MKTTMNKPIPIGMSAQIIGIGNPGIALLGYRATICVLIRHPTVMARNVSPKKNHPR